MMTGQTFPHDLHGTTSEYEGVVLHMQGSEGLVIQVRNSVTYLIVAIHDMATIFVIQCVVNI